VVAKFTGDPPAAEGVSTAVLVSVAKQEPRHPATGWCVSCQLLVMELALEHAVCLSWWAGDIDWLLQRLLRRIC
jgi:hypothetical protein